MGPNKLGYKEFLQNMQRRNKQKAMQFDSHDFVRT
jgi:hypothetical protein